MTSNGFSLYSGDSDLQRYITEIGKFPVLSLAKERELALELNDSGSVSAAEELVTSHLRLVVKIAFSYKNYGLSMMDIISEGNIGLMKAVKKFDISKGFRLSTYAMWWVKSYIQEYILSSWSLVKIGTTMAQKKLFFNLQKLKNKIMEYGQNYLDNDGVAVISQELGVTKKEVINMDSRLSNSDVYLFDKNKEDEEGGVLMDSLESSDVLQDEYLIEKQEKSHKLEKLSRALSSLKDREKEILLARRIDEDCKTLDYLSKIYNISKERVRQIEVAACKKIKLFFKNENN